MSGPFRTNDGGADGEGANGGISHCLGPVEDLHGCFGAPVGEGTQAGLDGHVAPGIQQEHGMPVQDGQVMPQNLPCAVLLPASC